MPIQPDRTRQRSRLTNLLANPPGFGDKNDPLSSIESQAHWAKYLCVLVSGYAEQSIREILLSYAGTAAPHLSRYVEATWPNSRNMKADVIAETLSSFSEEWGNKFRRWLEESPERKATINNVVGWRNNIAHGSEANTTGVTMNSVRAAFKCICTAIDFVEAIVLKPQN